MPLRSSDIASKLTGKFHFERRQGHHTFFERRFPGGKTVRTKVSHNRQEVGGDLEGLMAKQLMVGIGCFRGMISCSVSNEEYEQIVAENPPQRP